MSEVGYFQVSGKLDDGVIAVVNGASFSEFVSKLIELGGPEFGDQIVEKMVKAIVGNPASVARTSTYANGSFTPKAETPMTPVEVAAALGGSIDTPGPVCKHGEPAKFVPAGVSKATGKPYRAFYACGRSKETQCDFRANG